MTKSGAFTPTRGAFGLAIILMLLVTPLRSGPSRRQVAHGPHGVTFAAQTAAIEILAEPSPSGSGSVSKSSVGAPLWSPVPEGRHRGLPLHWGLVEIKVDHYPLSTLLDLTTARTVYIFD